jgi:beta-aspartyl-dipeptidase (metallo-type)
MGVSTVDMLIKELRDMVMIEKIDIQTALKFITSNPAKVLGIYPNKGTIAQGSDADVILLNSNLFIDTVFAKGKLMMESGSLLIKGTFE